MKRDTYPKFLLGLFVIFWIIMAIEPADRVNWALEHALVIVFIPALILTYKKFRFSNTSYTLMFLFMVLHITGAHYNYAEAPLGFWIQTWFGFTRNNFDRVIHFAYGLLMAYPIRDIFIHITSSKNSWTYYIPFEVTLAFSAIFEIVEWIIVMMTDPNAGATYIGMQGDIWDAQKDMALAGLGAAIAMGVTYFRNRKKK